MPNTRAAQNPVTIEDLEAFRSILATKRRELMVLYNHDVQVGQESNDESFDDIVDRANNSYNRELMFSLSDTERETLLLVEQAVERLEGNSFGRCTHCDDPIGLARLKAVPWARYCIGCQELDESGLLGR